MAVKWRLNSEQLQKRKLQQSLLNKSIASICIIARLQYMNVCIRSRLQYIDVCKIARLQYMDVCKIARLQYMDVCIRARLIHRRRGSGLTDESCISCKKVKPQ